MRMRFPADDRRAPASRSSIRQQPINCPPDPAILAGTPWGTVDRTSTHAVTSAARCRRPTTTRCSATTTHFTIGASVDHSKIGFQGNSELGYIYPDLFVGPNAPVTGTGEIIHTDAYIGLRRSDLSGQEHLLRALRQRTPSTSPRLSLTAGGRYNLAQIAIADQSRHQPRPQRRYTFHRFNPVFGLHLQDRAGADDLLCRLFGSQPRADAARARLLQSRSGRA